MKELQAKAAESEITSAKVPGVVRGAGGALLGAGALALLIVLQTVTGFFVSSSLVLKLIALGSLGALAFALGPLVMRARAWATIAGLVVACALFLFNLLWIYLTLRSGLLSLFALAAPAVSLLAVVLAAFAIEPARRATLARANLAREGLDLGI